MSIADDVRAAPRELHRKRAGAAAGVEHARAAQIPRQPRDQRLAHGVAAGAHRGADAADLLGRGQAPPGFDRGAVEVGLQFVAAGDVGGATSVEPQELEQVAVLHRRALGAGGNRPIAVRRAPYIRSAPLRFPARRPFRTGCISSAGCGAPRRDRGYGRRAADRFRRSSGRPRRCPALRLRITPPSRTS